MTSMLDGRARVALMPWMVVGLRAIYTNLRRVPPPPDVEIDDLPMSPFEHGKLIERLPLLTVGMRSRIRSIACTLPLFARPRYDALWIQSMMPLLPFLAACDLGLKRQPAIMYNADTTPLQFDLFWETYHGSSPTRGPRRGLRDLAHRYLFRHCAVINPGSHWAARSFVRSYGVPAERIEVIYAGVDLAAWTVPDHRYTGVPHHDEPFRILFVGGDFERKGGPLLLDVFRRELRDTCELHLVTKAELPEEPGLFVYRDFDVNAEGLRALYARCDALVLPTRADVFSIAAIEAMASGLPVITCAVGGIPEIVRDGETGFLVPVDDEAALRAAIKTLVHDRVRAVRMGLAGRRVAEETFDNSRNAARVLTILGDLAWGRPVTSV